eukprot:TRINITY_DN1994_c0_g1_i1.p1 TRINITY_DN1994_c0_g1~~TRINITY_DN1994_c0_g1_i1.p1  ORF type:complete len:515 (-),score=101.52 TRINITY_DN1994_c0_g1_i1:79-1623(-)
MTTCTELQSLIDSCQSDIERKMAERERALQERELSINKQRLRRILDGKRDSLRETMESVDGIRRFRDLVDKDLLGPHVPDPTRDNQEFWKRKPENKSSSGRRAMLDCGSAVLTGELEWSMRGFSWLEDMLLQDDRVAAESFTIHVGFHQFCLLYDPRKGEMGDHGQRASLAIMHTNHDDDGIAFRYKILIKSKNRGYVQWGPDGKERTDEQVDGFLFGPDVCNTHQVPDGIFGLTHRQLEKSEWVIDDVMTIKLQVQVRAKLPPEESTQSISDEVEVPPPSLHNNLLALLENGTNSDVTFTVQGETVQAHSLILSARSEVLQRQFSCGLQESASKRVVIEDCHPLAFKAFLRYLYSDSFATLVDALEDKATPVRLSSSSSSSSSSENPMHVDGTVKAAMMPAIQELLVLAHKYELSRLQIWCERELSGNIAIETVCSVLCQAHLYSAKKLEKNCLDFIKQNVHEVLPTEAFAELHHKWPQVSVKITAYLANVPEEKTAVAFQVQEKSRKRKLDD